MSRILVVGINYAPENIGTGKYTSEMCEWLVQRGHSVRVVTAPPYYPAWKTWPTHRIRWFKRELRNGVDVLRCPIWVPSKPAGFSRVLHLLSFALSSAAALASCLTWRPQLVLNIAPTLASAPGALVLAGLTGANSWLHVQDFEVDAALDMGIVNGGWKARLAKHAESTLLDNFDTVSSISSRMMHRLAQKGVPAQRQEFLPNWVDTDAIQPLTAPSPYRAELGIPDDAVVALYSGNMGLKQGLELLADAAYELAGEPRLYFVFGGEGPARAMLQQRCEDLANVRFLDLQPEHRLQDWLGLADIHLLPQRADVADLVMPSKLTGMLASGRPVLATALAGTGVAEAVAGCGLVTPPGHLGCFVDALRRLASDPAQRTLLGAAARDRAVHTLGRDAILSRLELAIARVLDEPPPRMNSHGPLDPRDGP